MHQGKFVLHVVTTVTITPHGIELMKSINHHHVVPERDNSDEIASKLFFLVTDSSCFMYIS